MHHILLCEDEENIITFLQPELEHEGYRVTPARDGHEALGLLAQATYDYDLVLLDVMLPGANGLEVLREIRKTSRVPVLILTARKEVYDKVAFLAAGADDYVTKPFDTLELCARIKRHIQRNHETIPAAPTVGAALQVFPEDYRVLLHGQPVPLTKTECDIFFFLYKHANHVQTRAQIIAAVFGDFYGESNVVDVNIKNIRAKLAAHSPQEYIATVRGKGYVVRV